MDKFKRISKTEIVLTNSETDVSVLYTGFTVGNLPKNFAFIYDEDEETEGYMGWFNLGGLTYINVT